MHPNEQVLRDSDDAQMRGDVEAFMGCYTDDIVVHISGSSPFAGEHRGREAFAKLFETFMERAPEFSFEPHADLADDEHGVILQRSHYRRGGEGIDTDDVFVCHFRDGKISEFWLRPGDQVAFDRFLG